VALVASVDFVGEMVDTTEVGEVVVAVVCVAVTDAVGVVVANVEADVPALVVLSCNVEVDWIDAVVGEVVKTLVV
jgi:hypothetical protein